jgi:asparagine synthase (glutamine-hydrolysing)
MSGHAGIYYYDHRPIDRSLAERLGAGLSRQGPDGGSERIGDGLLMVYRAFHVEPESYLETQPYVSPRGNWMTWDGRLDNRDDLLLLVKDHLEDDTTDVALAMAAYEKWGEPGFNRLIGDWSLALWDKANKSVVLASDYLGVRPLYYYTSNDCVAWSSDLGQVVSWFGVENDLDNHYIAAFLTVTPRNDRTIYRHIYFVPCAHHVRVSSDGIKKASFWSPPFETRLRYESENDYAEHLVHLFREVVLSRIRTSHGVCCDLSGGLDSSSITCMTQHLMLRNTTAATKLITFSLIDSTMDDERYIDIIEKHCHLRGMYRPFTRLWTLDAPSSPMPLRSDLLRNEGETLAREGFRAHLTGLGGDLVMGNSREDTDQLADAIRSRAIMRGMKEAYAWSRALNQPMWSTLMNGAIPLLPARLRESLWRKRAREKSQSYGKVMKQSVLNNVFLRQYLDESDSHYFSFYGRSVPSQRSFLFVIANYQASRPLLVRHRQFEPVKSTHPYCDRRLVEFVSAIPRQILCRPGRPRYLMRRALVSLLPPEVLERRTKAVVNSACDSSILELVPALSSSRLSTARYGCVEEHQFKRVLNNLQSLTYDVAEFRQAITLEIWFRTRKFADRIEAEDAQQASGSEKLGESRSAEVYET